MTSEAIITLVVAAMVAIPATIAALSARTAAKAALMQAQKTHELVNSRMTELLELARLEAGLAATLVEKEAEHVRKGEAAVAADKARRGVDLDSTGTK